MVMEQQQDKTKDEQQWNRSQRLLSKRRWAKYDGKGPLLLFDTLETAREYARLMGMDRHQAWWNHQGPEGPQFVTLQDPGVELMPLELPEGDPEDWPWHAMPFRILPRHDRSSGIQADHSGDKYRTKIDAWLKISSTNVQAHPPLGSMQSVETGVEAESTIGAAEQGGS